MNQSERKERNAIIALVIVAILVISSIVVVVYSETQNGVSTENVSGSSYHIKSISKAGSHKIKVKTDVSWEAAAWWGHYKTVKKITIQYQKSSGSLYPWIPGYQMYTKTIYHPSSYYRTYWANFNNPFAGWLNIGRSKYMEYYITLPSDVLHLDHITLTVSNSHGSVTMSRSCNVAV